MKETKTIKIRSKEEILIEWVEDGIPHITRVERKESTPRKNAWIDNIISMSNSLLEENLGKQDKEDFSRAYYPPH